ncbi:hypothetical protein MMC28_010182 [Mycoblastus sanguinarius]|nr:hypothetical protein [Mycoblastus sanguinarius]
MNTISEECKTLYNNYPNLESRIKFWLKYLEEVVPQGVTVKYMEKEGKARAEGIEIYQASGDLFMPGIIVYRKHLAETAQVAAELAFTKFDDEGSTGDWYFFVGASKLSFFKGEAGSEEYGETPEVEFMPIEDAQKVRDYLADRLMDSI